VDVVQRCGCELADKGENHGSVEMYIVWRGSLIGVKTRKDEIEMLKERRWLHMQSLARAIDDRISSDACGRPERQQLLLLKRTVVVQSGALAMWQRYLQLRVSRIQLNMNAEA
jgi:hypothetical protein